MHDTDWNQANGMVVPSQDAIGVMEGGEGQILIVQQGDNPEDDGIIAINRANLPALIAALSAYVERA